MVPEYAGSGQKNADREVKICQTPFAGGKLRFRKNRHQGKHFLCEAEAGNDENEKPEYHRKPCKKNGGGSRKQKTKDSSGSKPDGKP